MIVCRGSLLLQRDTHSAFGRQVPAPSVDSDRILTLSFYNKKYTYQLLVHPNHLSCTHNFWSSEPVLFSALYIWSGRHSVWVTPSNSELYISNPTRLVGSTTAIVKAKMILHDISIRQEAVSRYQKNKTLRKIFIHSFIQHFQTISTCFVQFSTLSFIHSTIIPL